MKRFDAAVIGAGPAGLSTALFLIRKGYSVAVLEKRLFPRHKLCGDFLSPINWPLFHRLGIVEEILSADHEEIDRFRLSDPGGAELTVPFPSTNGRTSLGLGLRREWLDHILLKKAAREGAMILQGVRARDIGFERGKWTVQWGDEGERLGAAILVGADGRNSWVAERLRIGSVLEKRGDRVAFQFHLNGVKGIGREVQVHLFPGGYAGLIGLGSGAANLCFTMDKYQMRNSDSVEGILEESLLRNRRLKEALDPAERIGEVHSAYPVFFFPRRSYGDGFVLVGDAARVTEPVTGEGVYFALRGGELAAEAIGRAFARGDFSAGALSAYERGCKRSLGLRSGVNRAIRALVYRPSLLRPAIELSSKVSLPIVPLVRWLCRGNSLAG